MALGRSLSDYYEGASGDETFGFFNVGAVVSLPLLGIPAEYGSWEISGGVNLLVFGDDQRQYRRRSRSASSVSASPTDDNG